MDASMAEEHATLGAATLENFAPTWGSFPCKKPIFSFPHPLRGLVLCSARGETNASHVGEAQRECPSQGARYPGSSVKGGVDRPRCSGEGGKQARGEHPE